MKTLQHWVRLLQRKAQSKSIQNVLELLTEFESYKGHDWSTYFDKNNPATTVIFQNEYLKMLLIYWEGFQKSNKHGHPTGGGLMRVLSGFLCETRFDPDDPGRVIGKFDCPAGALTYIHDELALHVVENPERVPAVSLHVYALKNQPWGG